MYDFTITQGSNSPIDFTFEDLLPADFYDLSISLISCVVAPGESDGEILKLWKKSDLTIDEYDVSCPLTQGETIKFKPGPCKLKAKWIRPDGTIDRSYPPVFGLVLKDDDNTMLTMSSGDDL